jgi:NSS family neurotransmitter:Na+ symporter
MRKGKGDKKFIITALGAVMGLGIAMRFPGLCAAYGGGAFIFAYAVCLVVLGYPLLCAEINLGKSVNAPFDVSLGSVSRWGKIVGRAACVNSAFIALYYSAIMAFIALTFCKIFVGSFSAANTTTIYSQLCEGGSAVNSLTVPLIFLLAVCWLVIYIMLREEGISGGAKFSVTLSCVLFAVVALRGLLYKNSGLALSALFVPKLARLTEYKLWLEAAAQVLLSLSLAAGVMPTFAPSDGQPAARCAAVIIGANFFGSVLCAVALFTSLYGCGLYELVTKNGIITTFAVYPLVLSRMFDSQILCAIFACVFYLSLFFTALQSTLSLLSPLVKSVSYYFLRRVNSEGCNASLGEKSVGGYAFERGKSEMCYAFRRVTGVICAVMFALSLPFAFGGRVHLLGICDFVACLVVAPAVAVAEAYSLRRELNAYAFVNWLSP